ncbi:Hypothetical protein PBC10988_23290 [Planctomycetales bacterium 10988]|nr:Hypothetical protein PBC10988_23290 [Planctomycetales bacterium 10988]
MATIHDLAGKPVYISDNPRLSMSETILEALAKGVPLAGYGLPPVSWVQELNGEKEDIVPQQQARPHQVTIGDELGPAVHFTRHEPFPPHGMPVARTGSFYISPEVYEKVGHLIEALLEACDEEALGKGDARTFEGRVIDRWLNLIH